MKAMIVLAFLAIFTICDSLPTPGDRSIGDFSAPVSMHQGNTDEIVHPKAVKGKYINSKIVVHE